MILLLAGDPTGRRAASELLGGRALVQARQPPDGPPHEGRIGALELGYLEPVAVPKALPALLRFHPEGPGGHTLVWLGASPPARSEALVRLHLSRLRRQLTPPRIAVCQPVPLTPGKALADRAAAESRWTQSADLVVICPAGVSGPTMAGLADTRGQLLGTTRTLVNALHPPESCPQTWRDEARQHIDCSPSAVHVRVVFRGRRAASRAVELARETMARLQAEYPPLRAALALARYGPGLNPADTLRRLLERDLCPRLLLYCDPDPAMAPLTLDLGILVSSAEPGSGEALRAAETALE